MYKMHMSEKGDDSLKYPMQTIKQEGGAQELMPLFDTQVKMDQI